MFIYHRIVKLTSPNLNHIIIMSSVLLYIDLCVFFYSYSSKNKIIQSSICNVSFCEFFILFNHNNYRYSCGCFLLDIAFALT